MSARNLLICIFTIASIGISGCGILFGTQQYWVQPGKNNQQTSADLHQCRMSVQPAGGNQVFSAVDLERSCMGSKGYVLSNTPTAD